MKFQLFISRVESNRGIYKQQDLVYPMLYSIYKNGTDRLKQQCTEQKYWGIAFIERIAVDLNKEQQDDFINWFYNQDNKSISNAKQELDRRLLEL